MVGEMKNFGPAPGTFCRKMILNTGGKKTYASTNWRGNETICFSSVSYVENRSRWFDKKLFAAQVLLLSIFSHLTYAK